MNIGTRPKANLYSFINCGRTDAVREETPANVVDQWYIGLDQPMYERNHREVMFLG